MKPIPTLLLTLLLTLLTLTASSQTPSPTPQTFPIFSPTDSTFHFGNGVVLSQFRDQLYCMWQASQTDEDASETCVCYAVSSDQGETWSRPAVLQPALEHAYCTSGGWVSSDSLLVAFVNVWPDSIRPKGGYTYYMQSRNGRDWSAMQPVTMADGSAMAAVIEQDFRPLASGRLLSAAHFQPGLLAIPIHTTDPTGRTGWQRAVYPFETYKDQSRGIEPSFFQQADGTLVMTLRDQTSTFRKLASVSHDGGLTWSHAVLTDMPDARTKQCAGNLPDGTAFQVGCLSDNKNRYPLTVSLSSDGWLFRQTVTLRQGEPDLQPRRYDGKAKSHGYSYPKALVANGFLYVGYATNKEDIEVTRIPITALESASSE